ncbi:MAG TPA: alpha/beta fold hydrolase [Burkholderiaceae bacterium]|nr:alpha/beta fold hydrolase [Burkholderiaceae bacterium]
MSSAPLLLLPGLLCDAAVWREVVPALGRLSCTVPSFAHRDSIAAMARDVLDAAPQARFSLVGHSMGARVAMEVVRLAPQRVARLALLDTGLDPLAPGADGERERAQRQALLDVARREGMRALGLRWAPGMVLPAHREAPVFEQILQMIERRTPEEFAAQIRALLGRPDARATFSDIRCPTLIGCGRQDAWSPLERHEQMHALLPGSRLAVFDGAGHMAPMEQPAAVAQALRAWLADGAAH